MKIIRIDRIGEYERRLELEFDGDDPSQFRRAAGLIFEAGDITHISIHVPREGHDPKLKVIAMAPSHFYPRAPGGARPPSSAAAWRATRYFYPRAP